MRDRRHKNREGSWQRLCALTFFEEFESCRGLMMLKYFVLCVFIVINKATERYLDIDFHG